MTFKDYAKKSLPPAYRSKPKLPPTMPSKEFYSKYSQRSEWVVDDFYINTYRIQLSPTDTYYYPIYGTTLVGPTYGTSQ